MTKRIAAKKKVYRQLGVDIWGMGSNIWSNEKWKMTPGEHTRRHRQSDRQIIVPHAEVINQLYHAGALIAQPNEANRVKISHYEPRYGTQLKEKQKLRKTYINMSETQFYNTLKTASNYEGKLGENLVKLLERRLDSVLYRAQFAKSMYQARQLINHGHILVNGKVLNIPSYTVKNGDLIQVNPKSYDFVAKYFVTHNFKLYDDLPHLEIDYQTLSCIYLGSPSYDEIPYPIHFDLDTIIRHYY
jgi:small subunit ribosomal protein S4